MQPASDIDEVSAPVQIMGRGPETEVHVVFIKATGPGPGAIRLGDIVHVAQAYDGTWGTLEPISGTVTRLRLFSRVSAAEINSDLHICTVSVLGELLREVSPSDPNTSTVRGFFDDVETSGGGEKGKFVDVGCASVIGEDQTRDVLHICGVTEDGRLWHTSEIQPDEGSGFRNFEDVEAGAGELGDFVRVDCAANRGTLHLVGVTQAGRAVHTMRLRGTWAPFEDVMNAASSPALSYLGQVRDVAIGFCNDEVPAVPGRDVSQLNLALSASDGLWHTIRSTNQVTWNLLLGPSHWKPRTHPAIGPGDGGSPSNVAIGSRPFFPSYELGLFFGGTGAGTVKFAPFGADCTSEATTQCLTGHDIGSKVTLEAVPKAGSRFVRWVGPCPAAESKVCTLQMDDHYFVTAHFEAIP